MAEIKLTNVTSSTMKSGIGSISSAGNKEENAKAFRNDVMNGAVGVFKQFKTAQATADAAPFAFNEKKISDLELSTQLNNSSIELKRITGLLTSAVSALKKVLDLQI